MIRTPRASNIQHHSLMYTQHSISITMPLKFEP
jgi:hypothetical protein